MTALDGEAPRIKVPIGDVAIAAYQAVFGRLGLALELGWIPILVLLVAVLVPGLVTGYLLAPDGGAVFAGPRGMFDLDDLAESMISVLCLNAFAVRWHHAMLFPDPQAVPRRLFLSAWARFVIYTLLFYVISLALFATIVASGVRSDAIIADAASAGLAASASVLAIAVSFAMVRCSLIFPAAAYGRPLGWGTAWRQMRGNTWRLIATTLLVLMPIIMIVGFVLNRVAAAVHFGTPDAMSLHPPLGLFLLNGVIEIVLNFVFVALSASILSAFYRRIVLRHVG